MRSKLGHKIHYISSNEGTRGHSKETIQRIGSLNWRTIIEDLRTIDRIQLNGDLLDFIQVTGVEPWQADLIKMGWCFEENPAEEQLSFLMELTDNDIQEIWKLGGPLTSLPTLEAINELSVVLAELDHRREHSINRIVEITGASYGGGIEQFLNSIQERIENLEVLVSAIEILSKVKMEGLDIDLQKKIATVLEFELANQIRDKLLADIFFSEISNAKLKKTQKLIWSAMQADVFISLLSQQLNEDTLKAIEKFPPPEKIEGRVQVLLFYTKCFVEPRRQFLEWCIQGVGPEILEELRVVDTGSTIKLVEGIAEMISKGSALLQIAKEKAGKFGPGMGGPHGYAVFSRKWESEANELAAWQALASQLKLKVAAF